MDMTTNDQPTEEQCISLNPVYEQDARHQCVKPYGHEGEHESSGGGHWPYFVAELQPIIQTLRAENTALRHNARLADQRSSGEQWRAHVTQRFLPSRIGGTEWEIWTEHPSRPRRVATGLGKADADSAEHDHNRPDPGTDWRGIAGRLAEALRLTQDYIGDEQLPPIKGWSWYDALVAWKEYTDA